ncbi:MAG TPA: DMT family transporter [Burkholderiales bacterium]|nr:DMT family transporter [Burkholderiales bacterium]
MRISYFLLAFTIGAGVAVQAGLNAQLRDYVGHPLFAALTNFVVGTLCLIGLLLVLRVPWPAAVGMKTAPIWLWLGGLLGAFYVASAVLIAPKLGAAVMFALLIAGQVAMSLILDHYGLIGFPRHPIGFWRIIGGALLVVGVVLVVRN